MPSPFPGMDPYLEQSWRDVQHTCAVYSSTELNERLPTELYSRIEQRKFHESLDDVLQSFGLRKFQARAEALMEGGVAACCEPTTEPYVTIREMTGERIISVIEFLSPSNKRGEGLADYLEKRWKLIEGGVSIVEVDLVRQGDWRPLMKPKLVESHLHTPYRVMIRRASAPRRVEFYAITLRQPLPIIPIPLRPTDADVTLDLQSILDLAYKNGRYDRTDYSQPCDPPLDAEDAKWAEELAKSRQSQS